MKTREDIIKEFERLYKRLGRTTIRCPYMGNFLVSCRGCLWTETKHSCSEELEELGKIAERRIKLEKLLT